MHNYKIKHPSLTKCTNINFIQYREFNIIRTKPRTTKTYRFIIDWSQFLLLWLRCAEVAAKWNEGLVNRKWKHKSPKKHEWIRYYTSRNWNQGANVRATSFMKWARRRQQCIPVTCYWMQTHYFVTQMV